MTCSFCKRTATTYTKQGLSVCSVHKEKQEELKCFCGKTLEVKTSKYGVFFLCESCGPMSKKKILS